jgi:hypothetical protein
VIKTAETGPQGTLEKVFGSRVRNGLEPPQGTSLDTLEKLTDLGCAVAAQHMIDGARHGRAGYDVRREVSTIIEAYCHEVVLKMMFGHRGLSLESRPADIKQAISDLFTECFIRVDGEYGEKVSRGGLHATH